MFSVSPKKDGEGPANNLNLGIGFLPLQLNPTPSSQKEALQTIANGSEDVSIFLRKAGTLVQRGTITVQDGVLCVQVGC